MKRGSTRFWLCASAFVLVFGVAAGYSVAGQKKESARKVNEISLASLRPGFDAVSRAKQLFRKLRLRDGDGSSVRWSDACRGLGLEVERGRTDRVSTVRVSEVGGVAGECPEKALRSSWRTGHDLAVGDAAGRVVAIYGEPTSRSPSTKNGQPLELLYYAFDWAGPDVPQVMEVVCTAPKDGTTGRVVEITLAASSL